MITIIISVYNARNYIDDCLSSIQAQNYADIEVILVDDGSTDGSSQLCDEWALKDTHIKVIHKANGGVSSARNAGLKEAKGEWVMFLDSDDMLAANACGRLMELQEEQDVDCVIFGIRQTTGNVWAPPQEALYKTHSDFKKDFVFWLNTELLSPVWNKLYKKELIKEYFPESSSFGEDLVFSLSYLKNCKKILFVPDQLYLHNNVNEASITHTFKENRIYDIEYWMSKVLDFSGDDCNNPELHTKYFKDILLYLKRLYGCDTMRYSEKKDLLSKWFAVSWLKKNDMRISQLGRVDKFLLFCIKRKMWLLPQVLLKLKHIVA